MLFKLRRFFMALYRLLKDLVIPKGTELELEEVKPPVATPPTSTPSTQLFSLDSFWNKKLTSATPIHTNSPGLVAELIRQGKPAVPPVPPIYYAPNINTIKYSTPLYIVGNSTPRVPVNIVEDGGKELSYTNLWKQSRAVPVPVGAIPDVGTDGHITLWDQDNDKLYEYFKLRLDNGVWKARWGGIIENVSKSDGVVPMTINENGGKEYQGASATSLPVIGGTMLLKEFEAGVFNHALAFSIVQGPNKWVPPALRTDNGASYTGPNAIPAGTRFRFPEDIVIKPEWVRAVRYMVAAIRDYGMVLRDTSGSVSFYAENTTPSGQGDLIKPFFDGKPMWDFMVKQFPWAQLQALA